MSDGGAGAPSACWNCRQPLTAGATRCIWCGVSLTAAAAPLVVAPSSATPAPAGNASAPPVAVATPAVRAPAAPAAPRAVPERGTSAGAAPRLVAVTVDLILLAAAGVAAFLLSRNPLLSAAVLAELLLLLWILDARTGATPGKALVRVRTALPGGTMSPGAGRSFGRGALTGAGLLVGGVGAWVVAASAAFDPWRRGWADRATDTVTVLVPARATLPAPAAAPLASPAAPAVGAPTPPGVLPPVPGAIPPLPPAATATPPDLTALPPPIEQSVIAEPRVVNIATPRPAVDEESASGAVVAAWAPAVAAPVVPPGGDAVAEESGVSLLLVFDTGQRVTFASPVAVNLGRNPAATTDGDRLVSVDDPESTVSKTHARLEHSRGATWITDGGSTNGTEILSDEGVATPLAPGRRTLLGDGDRVRLGRRVFTVSVLIDGAAG